MLHDSSASVALLPKSSFHTLLAGEGRPQHVASRPPWCDLHIWHCFPPTANRTLISPDTHKLFKQSKSHYQITTYKAVALSGTDECSLTPTWVSVRHTAGQALEDTDIRPSFDVNTIRGGYRSPRAASSPVICKITTKHSSECMIRNETKSLYDTHCIYYYLFITTTLFGRCAYAVMSNMKCKYDTKYFKLCKKWHYIANPLLSIYIYVK